MQTFFDWFSGRAIDKNEPWLILGKGPSFAKRQCHDLNEFHTLSLNHVVREQPVRAAHIIDYEVVDACAEAIKLNAEILVMPWRPHVNFRPSKRNLQELIPLNPTLRYMDERGRLVWYNLSSAREVHGDSPVVHVKYFSAEAALNLLATAGARVVRSLGVDGGASYSSDFDDLKEKTLLSGGHKTFDLEFAGIATTILNTGIDYAPLDSEAPIRIYVGSSSAEVLPVKVLEYSIRKHASMSVRVFPLHEAEIEVPQPIDESNRPRTPFSFQRFLIPELAGRRGRAIYLDSDMLVFSDIRRLWNLPFDGADLLATRETTSQFSVMVLDCESLDWDIDAILHALDAGDLSYEQLMFEMAVAKRPRAVIDPAWNMLDQYRAGETALLHYTDMQRQPWVSRQHPLNKLWTKTLFEAIDAGYIRFEEVEFYVQRGDVRPSLLYQVERRRAESRFLPKKARELDKSFAFPHTSHPINSDVAGHVFRTRLRKFVKTLHVPAAK
ncbi:MAG: hypothetical protein QOJ64_1907 [Acidobacteriota bacterium]|jgi:hypothetical protein|nr:hypothetical protein [Acidobacteriota bacterium]